MSKKTSIDPELGYKVQQLQQQIAENTSNLVAMIDGYWAFLNWASSSKRPLDMGVDGSDVILNQMQSSEFAFNEHVNENGETIFILFAQKQSYKWLSSLDIKNLSLTNDGIVVSVSEIDMYGVYVSGINFTIQLSTSNKAKLKMLIKNCKLASIGCIDSIFNRLTGRSEWSVAAVSNISIPLINQLN